MCSFRLYESLPVMLLGASGFVGRSVAQRLGQVGADLTVVVRDPASARAVLAPLGVQAVVAARDLERPTNLAQLIQRTRPSLVFNLAGYGVDPSETDEASARALNTGLVEYLASMMSSPDLPAWCGQRIVHAGSALEYGAAAGDLSEDTPALPTSTYGRTKLAGTLALEAACRTRGLRAVTARLFTVYGPGEHSPRLLPTLFAARSSDEAIALTDGLQRRDFTFVEDAAEGLLRLGVSEAPPGAIVNLATGRLTSVRAFTETAADVLGLSRRRLMFGALPTRPEEMRHGPVTIARLKRLTGWCPSVEISEGIARTKQMVDAARSMPDVAMGGQR